MPNYFQFCHFKEFVKNRLHFVKIQKWNPEGDVPPKNKMFVSFKLICPGFALIGMIPESRAVHFHFRAGSTFSVPVCTVPHGH